MSERSQSSFLGELKRRNLFRVALAYLIGAWLLIQIAETVFPYIGLPDRAITIVIVLCAIGFVPTMVFAWAFELTPEGGLRSVPNVFELMNEYRSLQDGDTAFLVQTTRQEEEDQQGEQQWKLLHATRSIFSKLTFKSVLNEYHGVCHVKMVRHDVPNRHPILRIPPLVSKRLFRQDNVALIALVGIV